MALNDGEVRGIAAKFAIPANATHGTQAVRAAVQDVDGWVDDNLASFVAALPEPFASASDAQQKTLLMAYVILRRAGIV